MPITIPVHKDALSFSRSDLPQIESAHVHDFIKHLRNEGIGVMNMNVRPASLKATQSEFNIEKVKGMMAKKKAPIKPSLSSADGYILDGHHRWIVDHNKGRLHNTMKIFLPIKELIGRAHSYEKSFVKNITEERIRIIEAATKKPENAYGWLNDKGSWIRNRHRVHATTFQKFGYNKLPSKAKDFIKKHQGDYESRINTALKHGWARLDVIHDEPKDVLWGLVQARSEKWTKRHQKGLERIFKAIGSSSKTKDEIERVGPIEESVTTGWIDDKGKWRGVSDNKLHYDIYMSHLKTTNPREHERLVKLGGGNWRQTNGLALRHAKRHGWLHTHIDNDGYGMIAGTKAAFKKHRAKIEQLKKKYSHPEIADIRESVED